MAGPTAATPDDAARLSRARKHDTRRDELVASALTTLAERGYAATSLRDIAQNSPFSHGVVHYYFHDKLELMAQCVLSYKDECVRRYDDVVQRSTTADGLVEGFAEAVVVTLRVDGHLHRLWYDLRAQSLFEPRLREAAATIDAAMEQMVWRVVSRYAALAGRAPALEPDAAYGVLDGVFQVALHAHLRGEPAAEHLSKQVRRLMPLLVAERGTIEP